MVATTSSIHSSRQTAQPSDTNVNSKAVTCTICCAQYAATQTYAYLVQAPQLARESAFMSMCHFCFRCRRPSCPLCWDDVHGLCGACVEDVCLPFRQQVAPLPFNSQLLIPAARARQQRQVQSFPLVCIQPGRFHRSYTEERVEYEETVVLNALPQREEVQKLPKQDEVVSLSEQENKNAVRIVRRMERMLTLFLGLVLFIIALLIVFAVFSRQANEAIVYLIHIDIRMEIEYLLQLIRQLFAGG